MPTDITVLLGLLIVAAATLAWRVLELRDREEQRIRDACDQAIADERTWQAARPALHTRVTASLLNDEGGLEGLVTEYLPDALRFEDVKFLAPGKAPEPVTGSVLIDRDRILLMQVHPG